MRRRHFTSLLQLMLAGLATTLALAWAFAAVVDVQRGPQIQASRFVDDERWTVERWDRAGAAQIRSTRARGRNWSPQQAAGPPDTPVPGDHVTAWASQTPDGGVEWLVLEYAQAVIPQAIEVYESHAPGALFKVTVLDDAGNETAAWEGTDPSAAAHSRSTPGGVPISRIPIELNTPTQRVKIYLNSQNVPSWNEIDAVALIARSTGATQWARRVEASSTYATGMNGTAAGGSDPAQLAPSWTRLDRPKRSFENSETNSEERIVDARGWPMLAMYSEVQSPPPATPAAAAGPQFVISGISVSGTIALTTPPAAGPRPPLPFRPIWIGLAVNTVFFAVCWLVIWKTLTVPRRFVRDLARMRRGACVMCGYDLGFDFIRGCPECGWRRSEQAPRSAAMDR